jgi:hypothetical protein
VEERRRREERERKERGEREEREGGERGKGVERERERIFYLSKLLPGMPELKDNSFPHIRLRRTC